LRGAKWVQKNESEKINQNENCLQFIKLISFIADFQKPLIGGIKYRQIHTSVIDWFSKNKNFWNLLVAHQAPFWMQ
jgi:hypothetical protein